MVKIKVKCDTCNKEFGICQSRYNKNKHKIFTCSKKCLGKKLHGELNTTCPVCGKLFHLKPYRTNKDKTHCCSKDCSNKLKETLYIGEKNPNKKYIFDDSILERIDNEFKAWLLGWIASDGHIKKNGIVISVHKKDKDVLEQINQGFNNCFKITNRLYNMVSIDINSKNIMNDCIKHLNLKSYGKKSDSLTAINIDDEYFFHFVRGYFEGDGHIRQRNYNRRTPVCGISSNSLYFLKFIGERINIPYTIETYKKNNNLMYSGVNCLDFLGNIYNNVNYKMKRKYDLYDDFCMWKPMINGKGMMTHNRGAYFYKTDINAQLPHKTRASDSGHDLTLIKLEKRIGNIELYDTGIKVKPPYGYYFDLVPRSSIIKTGYILANSVGIIDQSYLGNILVPLIKTDKSTPDLELPSKLVQLIPRPIVHIEFEEVNDFNATDRNSGGFGSTDNKGEKC